MLTCDGCGEQTSFVDREKKLLESYRTVDFVKIPDWENEALFAQQVRVWGGVLTWCCVGDGATKHYCAASARTTRRQGQERHAVQRPSVVRHSRQSG